LKLLYKCPLNVQAQTVTPDLYISETQTDTSLWNTVDTMTQTNSLVTLQDVNAQTISVDVSETPNYIPTHLRATLQFVHAFADIRRGHPDGRCRERGRLRSNRRRAHDGKKSPNTFVRLRRVGNIHGNCKSSVREVIRTIHCRWKCAISARKHRRPNWTSTVCRRIRGYRRVHRRR
jgi:hypothetical protein